MIARSGATISVSLFGGSGYVIPKEISSAINSILRADRYGQARGYAQRSDVDINLTKETTMHAICRATMIWAVGAAHALQAAPAPQNAITIVVSDGPFAGTYTAEDTACLHVKNRNTLGCGWKNPASGPKTKRLEEAGIQVDTVSAGPGARTGDVIVKFLDGNGEMLRDYSVSHVPMTLTRNGTVQHISFEGKTKEGVRMRVTGTLVQVDEF